MVSAPLRLANRRPAGCRALRWFGLSGGDSAWLSWSGERWSSTRKELLKVIACSAHAGTKFGLPSMTAADVVFRPEAGCVEIVFGAGSAARIVPLQSEVLGALLVFFCMGERVPLPRGAEKAVRVEQSAVVLRFKSEIGRAPGPLPAGNPPREIAKPVQSMSWVRPGATG